MSREPNPSDRESNNSITKGEYSVIIPPDFTSPLNPAELQTSLSKFIDNLNQNDYRNNKIPQPIRQGKESLADPERLEQALTPSQQFLAESLTPETEEQIKLLSREAIASQSPLKFQVDLGSFNIFEAQLDHQVPSVFPHLFLKQIHDYLSVLHSYHPGLDLTFNFDKNSDTWVYQNILPPQSIETAQSAHIEHYTSLIHSLFPNETFPRLNIQISESNDRFANLNTMLNKYDQILSIILKQEEKFFTDNPGANDWSYLFRQTRDPADAGHDYFYEHTDEFVSTYLNQVDPEGKLGLFRPTTRSIHKISQELLFTFLPERFTDLPFVDKLPYSGYLQKEPILDLTSRFIARELLNNININNNPNTLHLKAGDPNFHKNFYRRPGISFKPSSLREANIPEFVMPLITINRIRASLVGSHSPEKMTRNPLTFQVNKHPYQIPTDI